MDGQVVTWGVGDTLLRRPVQRGQILMTVVEPEGDWELELYLPEKRLGHLADALEDAEQELKVIFMLASHPGQKFAATKAIRFSCEWRSTDQSYLICAAKPRSLRGLSAEEGRSDSLSSMN